MTQLLICLLTLLFSLSSPMLVRNANCGRSFIATEGTSGDVLTATPIGRNGNPMDVIAKANESIRLNGVDDSAHALQGLNETKPSRVQKRNLAVGWQLVFVRHIDHVSIEFSIDESSFSIRLAEALNSFHAFSDKNGQMLISRVAAAQNQPSWKQQVPDPIA